MNNVWFDSCICCEKFPELSCNSQLGKTFQYFKNVVLLPLASMVFDEKSTIIWIAFLQRQSVISLWMLSKYCLCIYFAEVELWYVLVWNSLVLFYLRFIQLLESIHLYMSPSFRGFQPLFLWILKFHFLFLEIVWSK